MSHPANEKWQEAKAEYEENQKVEPVLEDDDSADLDDRMSRAYESQLERDHGYN